MLRTRTGTDHTETRAKLRKSLNRNNERARLKKFTEGATGHTKHTASNEPIQNGWDRKSDNQLVGLSTTNQIDYIVNNGEYMDSSRKEKYVELDNDSSQNDDKQKVQGCKGIGEAQSRALLSGCEGSQTTITKDGDKFDMLEFNIKGMLNPDESTKDCISNPNLDENPHFPDWKPADYSLLKEKYPQVMHHMDKFTTGTAKIYTGPTRPEFSLNELILHLSRNHEDKLKKGKKIKVIHNGKIYQVPIVYNEEIFKTRKCDCTKFRTNSGKIYTRVMCEEKTIKTFDHKTKKFNKGLCNELKEGLKSKSVTIVSKWSDIMKYPDPCNLTLSLEECNDIISKNDENPDKKIIEKEMSKLYINNTNQYNENIKINSDSIEIICGEESITFDLDDTVENSDMNKISRLLYNMYGQYSSIYINGHKTSVLDESNFARDATKGDAGAKRHISRLIRPIMSLHEDSYNGETQRLEVKSNVVLDTDEKQIWKNIMEYANSEIVKELVTRFKEIDEEYKKAAPVENNMVVEDQPHWPPNDTLDEQFAMTLQEGEAAQPAHLEEAGPAEINEGTNHSIESSSENSSSEESEEDEPHTPPTRFMPETQVEAHQRRAHWQGPVTEESINEVLILNPNSLDIEKELLRDYFLQHKDSRRLNELRNKYMEEYH